MKKNIPLVSAAQIRAARGYLGWTQQRLAKMSGISLPSIRNIEAERPKSRVATLDGIKAALESGGVVFINGGVAPRSQASFSPTQR